MDKFDSWAADCSLVVGKIYRQNSERRRIFHTFYKPHIHGEGCHKNDNFVPSWPDLAKNYMFIGRKLNETKSTRLYDSLNYFFLCGEDLFNFSLWDNSVTQFEKIWEEVG